MPSPSPTEQFTSLVQGDEAALGENLDRAALLVAAHARPGLDIDAHLGTLDRLADACDEATEDALVDLLFRREGFRGNRDDYYDPDNSMLDQVLERRLGIPLTLSLVTMEVGRRLGLRLAGAGMPGHFLVRTEGEPVLLLDAFDGGRRLSWADCEAKLRELHGPAARLDASMLDPTPPRALLLRLLTNLREIQLNRGDVASLEWVLRLRNAIPGVPASDRVELAGVLAARGRYRLAADQLDRLADEAGPTMAAKLRARAAAWRAKLN